MDTTILWILISFIPLTNQQPLTTSRSHAAVKATQLPSPSLSSLSHSCLSGWSQWINRNSPSHNGSDVETMTTSEKHAFCGTGKISSIECETVSGIPFYSSGEFLQCDTGSGLVCLEIDNFPVPCSDYRIRYLCTCASNPTVLRAQLTTTIFNAVSTDSGKANTINVLPQTKERELGTVSTSNPSVLPAQLTTSNSSVLSTDSETVNPIDVLPQSKENERGAEVSDDNTVFVKFKGTISAIIVGITVGILVIAGAIITVIITIKKKARKQKVGQTENTSVATLVC